MYFVLSEVCMIFNFKNLKKKKKGHLNFLVPKVLVFYTVEKSPYFCIPYSVSLVCGDWLASCHIAVLGVSVLLTSACMWMFVHVLTRVLGLLQSSCLLAFFFFLLSHLHALINVWRLLYKSSYADTKAKCTRLLLRYSFVHWIKSMDQILKALRAVFQTAQTKADLYFCVESTP